MANTSATHLRGRGQRGIALITVIPLLLVLTVLGITASVLMTQEDLTSSRQSLVRSALYAAEAGLRRGEANLAKLDTEQIDTALSHVPVTTQVWDGQNDLPTQPTTPGDPTTWTVSHLGTYLVTADAQGSPSGPELANEQVAYTGASGAGGTATEAFYSLYIRNNPDDPSVSLTIDSDKRVRLISVGFITSAGASLSGGTLTGNFTVLAVKILEEEWSWIGSSQAPSVQKQVNAGGTGSLLWGG